MWSFNRRNLLALGLALVMTGCGFTPVYGPGGGAHDLNAAVAVADATDRDSFDFVQQMEYRLGYAKVPRYRLDYVLRVSGKGVAITAENSITRQSLIGTAQYSLHEVSSGATLVTGQVESFTGYSATGSTIATQAAAKDARKRLMVILADKVVADLIAQRSGAPRQ